MNNVSRGLIPIPTVSCTGGREDRVEVRRMARRCWGKFRLAAVARHRAQFVVFSACFVSAVVRRENVSDQEALVSMTSDGEGFGCKRDMILHRFFWRRSLSRAHRFVVDHVRAHELDFGNGRPLFCSRRIFFFLFLPVSLFLSVRWGVRCGRTSFQFTKAFLAEKFYRDCKIGAIYEVWLAQFTVSSIVSHKSFADGNRENVCRSAAVRQSHPPASSLPSIPLARVQGSEGILGLQTSEPREALDEERIGLARLSWGGSARGTVAPRTRPSNCPVSIPPSISPMKPTNYYPSLRLASTQGTSNIQLSTIAKLLRNDHAP